MAFDDTGMRYNLRLVEGDISSAKGRLAAIEERLQNLEASLVGAPDKLALHADLIAAMRKNLTEINLERARSTAERARSTAERARSTAERVPIQERARRFLTGEDDWYARGATEPLIDTSHTPTVDPIHARAVADVVKQRAAIVEYQPSQIERGAFAVIAQRISSGFTVPGSSFLRQEAVYAAALLLAEIERLDRAALAGETTDASE